MGALQNLSCLAAKQLLAGAIKAVGTHTGGMAKISVSALRLVLSSQ